MDINGYQVEEHGSGYAVTLRLWVGKDEVADPMAFARNFLEGASYATAPAEKETEAEPAPARGRGSRRREVDGGDESRDSQEDSTPKRGRGRRGTSADTPAPDAGGGDGEDPTAAPAGRRGRRGSQRGASATTSEPSTDAGETAPSTSRGSRRGRSKSSEPSVDVTDEDLAKAVSTAAAEVGFEAVMELMEEFGVTRSGDMPAEVREEFLAQLNNLEK